MMESHGRIAGIIISVGYMWICSQCELLLFPLHGHSMSYFICVTIKIKSNYHIDGAAENALDFVPLLPSCNKSEMLKRFTSIWNMQDKPREILWWMMMNACQNRYLPGGSSFRLNLKEMVEFSFKCWWNGRYCCARRFSSAESIRKFIPK